MIFSLLITTIIVFGEMDSIHHRIATYELPDGTRIHYWFGQVTAKRIGGTQYIQLKSTATQGFLIESEPFRVSVRDSVFFYKTAFFNSTASRLSNAPLPIIPDTLYFGSTAKLRFIVESYDLDSKLIRPLDTLTCFRHTNGETRFQNSRVDVPFRRISAQGLGSQILIRVRLERVNHWASKLFELRKIEHQAEIDPYRTSFANHQLGVSGIDLDSVARAFRRSKSTP